MSFKRNDPLRPFEKLLGYRFKSKDHLRRALTHKSYANEKRLPASEHNERYEFLGDAVLELAVSQLLMQRFPDAPEGELSKLRAALVNEEQLAGVARTFRLGEFLFIGKGEDQTGGRDKPSLLSDALEAVFGAVFCDRGFLKARDVIEQHMADLLDQAGGVGFVRDYKTKLQEEAQSRFRTVPRYRLVRETGPDHRKQFEVSLSINNEPWSVGFGASKKAAEQDAARQALEKFQEFH
ncbi:MAG: ribonuclease III [Deltaproteobacteria bacterium]|nr:ribonuclease III [Deltaproteobacteria bacterium]